MKGILRLSIYTFVGFFGAGVNFLLLPLLSRYLSPEDYGITSLINTYVSILSPVVSLLAYSILNIEYFKIRGGEFASLFSSVQVIPVLPFLVVTILGSIFYPYYSSLLELPSDDSWVFFLMSVLAIGLVYIETGSTYLVAARKARLYAYFTIGRILTEVLMILVFVVHLKLGWEGRVWAWFVTTVLFAVFSFLIFSQERLLTLNIQKHYIATAIMFGIPLIAHTVGNFVINQSNRLLIAKMVSIEDAGIYNVGATIGMVILIFATALIHYLNPIIMEDLAIKSEEAKIRLVKNFYRGLLILFTAFIILNLINPLIFKYVLDPRYGEGRRYVSWVSLGYLFWSCTIGLTTIVYFYKQTKFLAFTAAINVISSISLNYFFIRQFGAIGSAYATTISFLIIFYIIFKKTIELVDLPWKSGFFLFLHQFGKIK